MVKMQAVQSALAVRRQRSRREEIRKAHRRESTASALSAPRHSVISIDGHVYFDEKKQAKTIFGHVTMFHVGGVLILIGLMVVVTTLMPSYVNSTTLQRRNDLLGTGCFFVFLGGVLTTVSRFISNYEEKELNQYIRGRLSRSKSAFRLNDAESGNQLQSTECDPKVTENGIVPTHSTAPSEAHSHSNGHLLNQANDFMDTQSASSSDAGASESYVAIGVDSPIPLSASTEPVLSRILEEDEVELDTEDAATEIVESSPESCVTPTLSSETQSLLDKRPTTRSGSKSSIRSCGKSAKLSS